MRTSPEIDVIIAEIPKMALPEDRVDGWTEVNRAPVSKIYLHDTSNEAAYLGDGDLRVSSPLEAKQDGEGKQLLGKSSARSMRAVWVALAATLSLVAVAFLVRRCFTGLQVKQPNGNFRSLAEASEASGQLDLCNREPYQLEDFRTALAETLETTQDYLSKEVPLLLQGHSVKMKRIASPPESLLTSSILFTIRLAEGGEKHVEPMVVKEWVTDFLKRPTEKQAKLLMGVRVFKVKYSELMLVEKFHSDWNAIETLMLSSAFSGQHAEYEVTVTKGDREAVLVLKMRDAGRLEESKAVVTCVGMDSAAGEAHKVSRHVFN
ncbi:hypothetical protein, conserved [Eimeria praecox]|uniref:Uncharacterized protein n=1 Tax=Eimeria praecox TaxID=51316 RepID=U6H5J6_9EIME|nr:hypothetical protein, conserved [Eimeria praecox]